MSALLWALDGALLDTVEGRVRALAYACERVLGSRVDALAMWRSHRGGTIEQLAQRVAGPAWRELVTAYRDRYYGCFSGPAPFAGLEAVLRECAGRDLPMAVVTANISWGATEELHRAGLLRYFQAVVGADDTDNHKPDPEPIYEALERLLVDDAREAVLIGGSPADVFAARNAGCASVAAAWATLDAELLLDAHPGFVARQPAEVLAIVAALERRGVSP